LGFERLAKEVRFSRMCQIYVIDKWKDRLEPYGNFKPTNFKPANLN